jgi:hypothetical protein
VCLSVIDPAHAVTAKTVLTMQNPDELSADLASSKQEYHVTDAAGAYVHVWQGCMIMHIPAGPFVPASVVLMVVASWLWLCMRARP